MKCYTCGLYPSLTIGQVGRFTNGVLELDDPAKIRKLEACDSFKQGIVREYIPDPSEVVPLPSKSDVVKMTKAQLISFAEEYGLDAPSSAKRNELVTLVLEFITEASEELE